MRERLLLLLLCAHLAGPIMSPCHSGDATVEGTAAHASIRVLVPAEKQRCSSIVEGGGQEGVGVAVANGCKKPFRQSGAVAFYAPLMPPFMRT